MSISIFYHKGVVITSGKPDFDTSWNYRFVYYIIIFCSCEFIEICMLHSIWWKRILLLLSYIHIYVSNIIFIIAHVWNLWKIHFWFLIYWHICESFAYVALIYYKSTMKPAYNCHPRDWPILAVIEGGRSVHVGYEGGRCLLTSFLSDN